MTGQWEKQSVDFCKEKNKNRLCLTLKYGVPRLRMAMAIAWLNSFKKWIDNLPPINKSIGYLDIFFSFLNIKGKKTHWSINDGDIIDVPNYIHKTCLTFSLWQLSWQLDDRLLHFSGTRRKEVAYFVKSFWLMEALTLYAISLVTLAPSVW